MDGGAAGTGGGDEAMSVYERQLAEAVRATLAMLEAGMRVDVPCEAMVERFERALLTEGMRRVEVESDPPRPARRKR